MWGEARVARSSAGHTRLQEANCGSGQTQEEGMFRGDVVLPCCCEDNDAVSYSKAMVPFPMALPIHSMSPCMCTATTKGLIQQEEYKKMRAEAMEEFQAARERSK